jgi:hypothetical protein
LADKLKAAASTDLPAVTTAISAGPSTAATTQTDQTQTDQSQNPVSDLFTEQ